MSGPNSEESAGQPKVEVTVQPLAEGSTNAATTGAPRRPIRRGPGPTGNRAGQARGIGRNRSGPMQRSNVPIRGVNRNRSGPMRGVSRNKSGPMRGVSRNKSSSKNRALPLKTNSFHRAVPDRASSTSSLRKYRRQQNATPGRPGPNGGDTIQEASGDGSVTSNQTKDSILVRKSQISGIPADLHARHMHMDDSSAASASLDLDAGSLHTMDSMFFHHKHVDDGGFADDMSAFEESFISTATYMDDYGDDDFASDVHDQEHEHEPTHKIDIEMQDLKIAGGKKNEQPQEETRPGTRPGAARGTYAAVAAAPAPSTAPPTVPSRGALPKNEDKLEDDGFDDDDDDDDDDDQSYSDDELK